MTPNQVFTAFRKRWKFIALIFVVGVALSVGLTLTQTKQYTATTQLFVSSNTNSDSGTSLVQGNSFITARVQNYTIVAQSPRVTDAVIGQIQAASTTLATPPTPSIAASPTPSAGATPSASASASASATASGSASASATTPTPTPTPSLAATDSAAVASAASFKQDYPDLVGLQLTSSQLGKKIDASVPNGKVVLNLSVTDPSPRVAAELANLVRETLVTVITTQIEVTPVLGTDGKPQMNSAGQPETTSTVNVVTLQNAQPPQSISSPNVILNLGVGAIAGLLLGLVLAIMRDILDNTFKSPDQLTHTTGLPVLGVIPLDRHASTQTIAFHGEPRGQRAEAFRHLRTSLDFVGVGSDRHVLAITSAVPGEGKTLTAINVAAALAEGGQRVCLVEADLRKPTIADRLGLVREVGLTSVLIGKAQLEDVLQNAGQNLAVLTSGEIPPNPSELLRTKEFVDVLDFIAEKVDRVIVDCAPLLPVADGADVAAVVGETLLCVRAGKTTREQTRRSVQTLANVGVTPVGALLSMASQKGAGLYDYYAYYGQAPVEKSKGGRRRKNAAATEAAPAAADSSASTAEEELPGLHGSDEPAESGGTAAQPADAGSRS